MLADHVQGSALYYKNIGGKTYLEWEVIKIKNKRKIRIVASVLRERKSLGLGNQVRRECGV